MPVLISARHPEDFKKRREDADLRHQNHAHLYDTVPLPDAQILPRMLQPRTELPGIIVISLLIHVAERAVDREVDFQLAETVRAALHMIQEFLQLTVRQIPLQVWSDQLLRPYTIHTCPLSNFLQCFLVLIQSHLTRQYFDCFDFSISATSRKPRGEEVDGRDYYFLSHDDFKARVDKGDFLEWEEVYSGTCYGTLKSEIQRIWDAGKVIVLKWIRCAKA